MLSDPVVPEAVQMQLAAVSEAIRTFAIQLQIAHRSLGVQWWWVQKAAAAELSV